jgi:folate-binding protein YgfZ
MLAVKANNKGRVEGVLRVRMGAEAIYIDVLEVVAAKIRDVLEKFIIMDDCAVRDVSNERTVAAVYGPESRRVLSSAGLDPGALEPLAFAAVGEHTIIRDTWLGVDGYELHGPDILERLLASGAKPVSAEAVDAMRIEAGVPIDGADLDEEVIPLEARLEHAIDFAKGCYVGQETIARASNFGQVRHVLVGFDIGGERAPPPGARILSGNKETGEITSAVVSPTLGRPIGMGYVRKSDDLIGNWVTIEHEGQQWEATVAALPFVSP